MKVGNAIYGYENKKIYLVNTSFAGNNGNIKSSALYIIESKSLVL